MNWMFWRKKKQKNYTNYLWLLGLIPVALVGIVLRERPWRKSYQALKTHRDWQEGSRKQGRTGGPEKPADTRTGVERRKDRKQDRPEESVRSEVLTKYQDNRETAQFDAAQAQDREDDLEIIEGIGPKISGILKNAGVRTFDQLANTSLDRLEDILRDGGIRIAAPETWAEQSRLAANGDWDGLEDLKQRLHAGRR